MHLILVALAILFQDPAPPGLASRGSLRHASSVAAVAFSADSKTAYAGLDDGQLIAWSIADRKPIAHGFRDFTGIRALAVSRDGSTVAVATQNGLFYLLDSATLKEVKSFNPGFGQTRAAFAPDGKAVFVALLNGHLLRIKVPELTIEKDIFPTDKSLALALACSPDGRWVATSDREGGIKLWTAETLEPVRSWKAHERYARSFAFHPSKPLLASGGEEHALMVWNAEDGSRVAESKDVHHEAILGLAFAPDGTLVSGGQDGLCQFWEADTFKAGRSLPNYRGFVASVAVSPDGKQLVRGGSSLDVVPMESPDAYERVASYGGSIQGFDVAADRKSLVSVSLDRQATVWKVTDRIVSQSRTLEDWGSAAAFSRDGKFVAIGLADGSIELCESEGMKRVGGWKAHRGRVATLTATSAGWASGGDDEKVRLWSSTGESAGEFAAEGGVRSMTAHGSRVAAGTSAGEVALFDAEAKALLRRSRLRPLSITTLRFSPEGTRIAAGYFDGTVEVLDPERLASTVSRKGDGASALAVDFNPKGDLIAAGFRDGMLRIMDAASLEAAVSHPLDSGREVFGIRFVLNDTTFCAAGADHALTFWAIRGDLAAWRAKAAAPQESRWEGRWTSPDGFGFDFVLDLKVEREKATGRFTWTLKECPETRGDLKERVGASATEDVEGTWTGSTRMLEVRGSKSSDEALWVSESYRLKLSDSGETLEGNSSGHGMKWDNKVGGKRTSGRSPRP